MTKRITKEGHKGPMEGHAMRKCIFLALVPASILVVALWAESEAYGSVGRGEPEEALNPEDC